MIPANMRREKTNGIPMGLLVALGAVALLVVVFAGVALTMGTPPAQEAVTVEIPLE
ncbi:MAG: hypothetical protein H6922_02035 [Pseudomonadaceae bacterium]|nr:hypothetical protein [Pseudomonadaceae bacterium]